MKDDRIYEQMTGHARSMSLNTLIEVSKSICKIIKEGSQGTGFFLEFEVKNNCKYYFLVTANHVIDSSYANEKKCIEIILDNGNIKKEIKLDKKDKRIYLFLQNRDITAIQILEKDDLKDKIKYLKYDSECDYSNYGNYLNIDAFIMHHPNGEELKCNSGKIVMVREPQMFEFIHTLDTDEGSSGAPILSFEKLIEEPKVFGIHSSACIGDKKNIGIFINNLIESLNKEVSVEYFEDLGSDKNHNIFIPKGVNAVANTIYVGKGSTMVVNGTLTIGGP